MKASSVVFTNNETTVKTDQNEVLDHNLLKVKPANQNLFSPKFLFSHQLSSPIPSYAYSYDHADYAQRVKEQLSSPQNENRSIENTILSESISKKPKSVIKPFKAPTQSAYLADMNIKTALKLLRLARCSILLNCFTDVLTIGFPVFIFCIIIGLKGIKQLKIWNLVSYLGYLLLSTAPYLYVEVFYWRVEVRVILGFVLIFKLFNFFIVFWLTCRVAFMKTGFRSKLIVDYNTNPGPPCLICC